MLCVTVLLLVYATACAETPLRVLGGRDALPGELPYVVRLERKKIQETYMTIYHDCTGTVISPTWVLTAAHCLDDGDEMVIRYGSIHNSPFAADTFRSVVETIKHPKYIESIYINKLITNDIGLLRIEPLKLQQYGRLSSVPYWSLIGLEALVAGYGVMNASTGQSTFELKKPLQILQVLLKKCVLEGGYQAIPSLCLSPLCGRKAFTAAGDSGGPVLHNTGVVGVVSSGYGTEKRVEELKKSYHTSQMVPVSPYLDWISFQIKH